MLYRLLGRQVLVELLELHLEHAVEDEELDHPEDGEEMKLAARTTRVSSRRLSW